MNTYVFVAISGIVLTNTICKAGMHNRKCLQRREIRERTFGDPHWQNLLI